MWLMWWTMDPWFTMYYANGSKLELTCSLNKEHSTRLVDKFFCINIYCHLLVKSIIGLSTCLHKVNNNRSVGPSFTYTFSKARVQHFLNIRLTKCISMIKNRQHTTLPHLCYFKWDAINTSFLSLDVLGTRQLIKIKINQNPKQLKKLLYYEI